jgi:quercetin dioxygenase-like cupin family protein
MKRKWTLALLVVVVGAALYGGHVLATPSSGLTTTIYAKSLFDPVNLKGFALLPNTDQQKGRFHWPKYWRARIKTHGLSDVYVVDNKIAPGGTTGWHSHPGPSMIFVVAGTVTNYMGDDPTCTGESYSAGSGFTDPGGTDVHMLRNDGSVPAETIAVQFLPTGAVRRTDMPDPGNCPS